MFKNKKSPKNSESRDSTVSEHLLHLASLIHPPSFSKCMGSVLSLTLPSAVFTFIQCTMLAINVHFISQTQDEDTVAGLGLGLAWLMATIFGIILSLNTGTTVLAAQALGALSYSLVPLYFHRALVLRAIQALACYILCACSVWIFELLDFAEPVAQAASECCVFSFLAIIGLTLYDTLKAYVNAHTTFFSVMIIQIFVLIGHWFYCSLFVTTFGLGIKGTMLALGLSQLTGSVILLIYIIVHPKFKRTRRWPGRSAFCGIWTQFVNEVYVSSFFVLQLLAFTICVLMSGTFTLDQTVSQTFIYIIALLLFAPVLALSETAMILIGNSLGRKEAPRARKISKALLLTVLLFLAVEMSVVYFWGDQIVRFLFQNEKIVEATTAILQIFIWIMPADFIQMTLMSILKGAMRERLGFMIALISLYAIGISGAFIFGVGLGWSAKGVWLGMGIGIYSLAFLAAFLLWKTDYESQIRKIDDRMIVDDFQNPIKSMNSTRKDILASSYISEYSVISRRD